MQGSPSTSTATTESGMSGIVWHASHTAKAQHALSLFANLRADLRTAQPAAPSTPLPADPPPRAASATRGRRTSAPLKRALAAPAGGESGHAATPAAPAGASSASTTPTAVGGRRSGSHTPRRPSQRRTEEDLVAPPTYTEAELEAFSPAQLRRQLRLAAAVTQRLHLRARRLEGEAELWKRRCAERGTHTANPAPAPMTATVGPASRCSTGTSASVGPSTEHHSPHSDATADTAAALRAADDRAAHLQATVQRLEAHKEELTRRLYTAEKSVEAVTKELQAATAHAAAASAPAPVPCAAEPPEACAASPPGRRPSARDGASSGSPISSAHGSTTAVAADESPVLLRDSVRDLQHRLTQSEAQTRQAVQLQLDALLRHRESTPAAVALVNAEVQRLFQLMQHQLMVNAAQQQVERARMNELFYQLERGRGAH